MLAVSPDSPALPPPPFWARWLVLLIAFAVTGAFFLDLCDLIFQCGCNSWWNGAAEQCNIQQAGPPDCPWCASGRAGMVIPFGTIAVAQALIVLGSWPRRLLSRLGLALLAFPVAGAGVGAVFGIAMGYWR